VHPMEGDEIRALRHLQREEETAPTCSRVSAAAQCQPRASATLFERLGRRAAMPFTIFPHMLRRLANAGHDTRAHKNIQHTVRYTELAPDRFKDFWR
jgi:hypothetical protein